MDKKTLTIHHPRSQSREMLKRIQQQTTVLPERERLGGGEFND
jgi:hypothetical protein